MTDTVSFSHRMSALVDSARASRDTAFNSIDAIDRQTRAACDSIARDARQWLGAEVARTAQNGTADERDARFDPEDEWELTPPTASSATAAPCSAHSTDDGSDNDDDSEFPDTWLR